jgi:hypothetical protein
MGPSVIPLIEKYGKTTEAEVQKRVDELLQALDAQASMMTDDEREFHSVRDEDSLVTPSFQVIGKVTPTQVQVVSKYGTLRVKLEDVREILQIGVEGAASTKRFTVDASHRATGTWLNTGMRLKRGTDVRISATGQITMSPWGSNHISTPDGTLNIGWYISNQVPYGALIGRIGENGDIFMVGQNKRFKADGNGTLYLAFAMNQNYNNNQFPGQYKVTVRTENSPR